MESPSTPHSGLASQRIGKVSRVFLRKHSLWTLVKLARGYACMMGLSAPKHALGLRIWPRETRLPVSVLKAPWKTTHMVRIRGSSWSGGYLPNSPSPVSHIPKNVSITCKEGKLCLLSECEVDAPGGKSSLLQFWSRTGCSASNCSTYALKGTS